MELFPGNLSNIQKQYLDSLNDFQKEQLREALSILPEGRRDGLRRLVCTPDMHLNSEQHEALLHRHSKNGPLLILAGAGSGKTAVMTRRIVFLMLRGVSPTNIFATTFTNKAANEMKIRAKKIFSRSLEECSPEEQKKLAPFKKELEEESWIGTFHSLGKKILELSLPGEKRPLINRIHDHFLLPLSLLEPEESHELFEEVYNKNPSLTYSNLEDQKSKIYEWRNDLVLPKEAYVNAEKTMEKTASKLYRAYQEEKLKSSPPVLDFADLLSLPSRLLRDDEEVRDFLQDKFKYVLIDEFQDTNQVQLIFSQYLSKEHRRLTAVGDDAQSIYGWRGADITNIQQFKEYFPDAKIVRLQKNYRSTPNIVEASNKIFKGSKNITEKKLEPGQGTGDDMDFGDQIALFELRDAEEELEFLSHEIKRLVRDEGYGYGDIAVFYRVNYMKEPISNHLHSKNIHHMEMGDRSFLHTPRVALFLSLLKIIEGAFLYQEDDLEDMFPHTEALREWWLREGTPFEKSTRITIKSDPNLFEVLVDSRRTRTFCNKLTDTEKEFFQQESQLLTDLFGKLLKDGKVVGLVPEVAPILKIRLPGEKTKLPPNSFSALFIDWVKETSKGTGKQGLITFMDNVEQQKHDPQFVPGNPENFVKLTTLHGAKGLEFPVVFFTGLEEGMCPYKHSSESKISRARLAEEKRLFYVGVTRAEEILYLTWAKRRTVFDRVNKQERSRFLQLLPGKFVDHYRPNRSLWKKIKDFIFS